MRVYTKLSTVIADDSGLSRRFFSVEDIEENDDTASKGGGPGGFVLAAGLDKFVDVSLQAVNPAKHLVLLVNGSVDVKINDADKALRVSSSGADKTFVWGKLLLTGTAVASLKITNASASTQASCLLGYAG